MPTSFWQKKRCRTRHNGTRASDRYDDKMTGWQTMGIGHLAFAARHWVIESLGHLQPDNYQMTNA